MIHAQNVKYVYCVPPQAIKDNASWTTAELDCKGWDYLEVIALVGATDIAMAALSVTESDTSGSGHADVTGLVWGTSSNIDGSNSALPSATDDNTFQVAQIDLRKRKRYIDVTATAGDGTAGTYATIIYRLSRGEIGPNTMAEMGCNEVLRV